MIGRRSAQADLFDVGNVYPLELDARSFFGQLAAGAPHLFSDDDFQVFYSKDTGRPSVPPSQLALMTLMKEYTGCSDAEAVERTAYDLRWAAVLRRAAGEPLCVKSTFQLFRVHLVLHDAVRMVYQKSIAEAKAKGLLKRGSPLRLLLDTKPVLGRGAVKDTYNLLGDGIRQLVRGMAADAGQAVDAWATAHDLGRYFGSSVKGEAEIDWADEVARNAFLNEIVTDARRLLRLAGERLEDGGGQGIKDAAKLLEDILLQDVVEKSDGEAGATMRKGTAPNRIPSATDREQRHGHKSKSKLFTGHKAAIAVDSESGIITDADVLAGNAGDSEGALGLVEGSEQNTREKVGETTADCAYGGGETMQAFADAERDFMAKMPQEPSNADLFPKSAFTIDFANTTVTCPQGNIAVEFGHEKNGGKVFRFGEMCDGCPLREQCTRAAGGRTIRVHPQEQMRQAARAYQQTPEGRARMRGRVGVEHALARLGHLGIGQARYVGRAKTRFQLLIACTVANLRRAWNWAAEQAGGCTGASSPQDARNSAHRAGQIAEWRLLGLFWPQIRRLARVIACPGEGLVMAA